MSDLLQCPCSYDMSEETTTQFLQFGKSEESFQYVCPMCGLASPAGANLEYAQAEWNALCMVIEGFGNE